ncbi:FCD domain-containing protein [Streptomyces sp. NPDC055506]
MTTPSRREITELFEMKELLEGAAARLLARRGRVTEIDLLERNLREADEAVDQDDRERYAELVQEFHDLLITGADNGKLEAHYRMLMNQRCWRSFAFRNFFNCPELNGIRLHPGMRTRNRRRTMEK